MNAYNETVLEHQVSSLVENQFPEFYRDSGPIFVAFVKEYFKWLEGSQTVSNTAFVGKGYLKIQAGNTTVQGFGTDLFSTFANGDTVAIYSEDSIKSYQLAIVNNAVNSSIMTLTSSPSFSSSNSWYTTTYTQNNPNYYMRRFLEVKDIDTTTEDFLVYFKEKYLKNIQFTTKTDIQTLLKHSLNLYRAKGTPRAIDLLFRAVFGIPASVYYPSEDIFSLSSGQWNIPKYLEISLKENSIKLIGKQIVGSSSGATAFAESLIRRTVKGRLIDVLYISAIEGNFIVGESINSADNVLDTSDWPAVVGSMTEAIVDSSGSGSFFNVGDVVDIFSNYGEQGKAVVQNVTDITGIVNFSLDNGGFGYQNTAQVLVSQQILSVSNVHIDANNNNYGYVYMFDHMVEPLANITYTNITSNLAAGDLIYNWSANAIIGTGRVLTSAPNTSTTGYVWVSELSGTLNGSALYTASNTKVVNVGSYTNAYCTANVIGYYPNTVHTVTSRTGNFIVGEEIYQVDQYGLLVANGTLAKFETVSGNTAKVTVSNTYGIFKLNNLLNGRLSNTMANIQSTDIFVGYISRSNTFYSTTNNYVYFANSLSNGTITAISQGTLANVTYDPNMIYTESVVLANDYISPKLSTSLAAVTYNFAAFPSGNLTTGTISQLLANQAYTVGKIAQLSGINKGSGYNQAPIVKIYDPIVSARYKQDVILDVTGVDGVFQVGELVTQTIPGSRGIVKSANSTEIRVEQLRVAEANNFVITANTNTVLMGAQSLASANVIEVDIDTRTNYLGFNAQIGTNVLTAPGAVTNLQIIQSGFGHIQADSIRFVPEGQDFNYSDAGFGFANLDHQGFSRGYYKKKGGWLSDQSKLFDGIYYQNYSYEVRTSITLDKYEEMLKQILHVAGTKYFGALYYRSYVQSNCAVSKATITVA
jgi:hypothetical protein